MFTNSRSASFALALTLGLGALALPGAASAAPGGPGEPLANATTTAVVPTGTSTTLAGLSVTDPTATDLLQVTLSTDLGTLTLPTTTGLSVGYGDSFTTDPSISFTGTVPNVNAALAAARLDAGSTTGSAHVSLSAMVTDSSTRYNPANGHFYRLVSSSGSWTAARSAAAALSFHGLTGYLATPATPAANTYLTGAFPTPSNVWIGGQSTDAATTVNGSSVYRSWKWVTGPYAGTPFTYCTLATLLCVHTQDSTLYSNWGLLEPDNNLLDLFHQEDYAATNYAGAAGSWNDSRDDGGALTPGGYLVEFGTGTTSSTPPTGLSTATASVTVAARPAAPSGVTVSAGDQRATATFTAPADPAGAPVSGYTVTATPHAGGTPITGTCTTSPCAVTGLTNGTAYDVTVRANSAAGNGAESAAVTVTPAGAPGAPGNVTATAGDGQASVAFTAPTGNNGATIASYTVTATPSGGGTAVTRTCTTSPCVLTGLTNGTAYAVTVHATSTLGVSSAETAPVTVTSAGRPSSAPAQPSAAAGDGQATLTFTPVTAQPSIIDYTATATPTGGGAAVTKVCSGSPCVVTGLANGTQYSITLHARNSAGDGPESAAVSVVPAGRPGAPTIGSVTRSNGGASVSYVAGADNGPTPTFTLNAVPATGSGGAAPSATCSANPCSITGLTNGVGYTFTVTATSTTGLSATSAASSPAITAASVPDAPASFTETDGSNAVTISFTAPAANGDPIAAYQYLPGGSSTWQTLTTTTDGTTVTATVGLPGGNGTTTTFAVRAVNSVGASAASATITARPAALPAAPTNASAQRINGGASITFTTPADPATAPVSGYTVTAIPSTGSATTTQCATNPCDVTGLTPAISYTFTVIATNRIGSSTGSSPTSPITAAKVPDAPVVTAAPKDGSVQLTITAGADNGDSIQGYTVTTTPGGGTTTCAPGGPCVVDHLTDGTTYGFSVVATNAIGSSAPTTVNATPQGVPTAITGLTAAVAPAAITVTFDASSATGPAAPTGYEYSVDGGLTWHQLSSSTSGGTVTGTIGGLQNGQPYPTRLRAVSSYGDGPDVSAGTLTPVALPGQPTGVSASRVDGGAQVTFTAPSSTTASPVTGYTVTAYPTDGSPSTSVTCAVSPCTITNMTVGSGYTFSVTATNASGGTASTQTPVLVVAAKPGVPTGVSAAPKDASAAVSFTAPSGNGAGIDHYTVIASPGGATATCTISPCLVTGLSNAVAYTFTVTATNDLGTSAASTATSTVTPQAVPVTLTGGRTTPGDSKVTVSFTTPVVGTIPSTYEYSFDGSTWTTATDVVSTNGTSSFDITGLTNGTPVDVNLRGQSAFGPGPSADLGFVTPALAPGAPGSPTVTRQPDGDLQVSFAPPTSDGGSAITGYEYTTDGGTTWHPLVTTGTSPLTGTITGLTDGTEYQVAARAVTPVGHSDSSAVVTVVAASAPGAPTVGTVTPFDQSADVAVTAPSDDGGDAITGYTVTAIPATGTSGSVTVPCSASPCHVMGLTNGTGYTFTARATNGVGSSIASAPSGAVTPRPAPGQLAGAGAVAGDGSATVTFTTPSGTDAARPTSYEYSLDGLAWLPATGVTDNGDGTTSFTVSPLSNGVSVHLDVRGDSSYGPGARTNLGTVTPSAPPADGVPGSPTAVRQANGDVRLTFALPTGSASTGFAYDLGDNAGWHLFTNATVTGGVVVATIDHTALTEGTTYSVTVGALHGTETTPAAASTPVTIRAAAAPDAPGTVTATARDAGVDLSFAAPSAHGEPILSYDYSTDNGASWHPLTSTLSGSTVSGTVLGLTDGSTYSFVVRAANLVGYSDGSAATAPVTPLSGPTAPTGLTATAGPGSVTVAFTAPSGDATTSAPTGYEYSTDGGVTWHPLATSTSGGLTSGTIAGLVNGTSYDVQVRATGSTGTGTPTTGSIVTPAAPPGAPGTPAVSVVGTTATLTWTPAAANGAGPVHYTVTSTPAGLGCADTTVTTCTVTGLVPGTSYQFTVTPRNAQGTGAATTSSSVSVSAMPSSPGSLTVTGGDRSLTVTFTPPSSSGASPVTGYQVSIDGGLTWQALSPTGSGVLTATIAPVLSGQTYPVVVRALNSNGPGQASGVVMAASSSWYGDPLSTKTRSKEIKVPKAPKRYHGKKRSTTASYRASGGQVVVPAGTPAGRQLQAGQGVQLSMTSLFKGKKSTRLTKRGEAQIAALATSLRYVHAVSCEGYTDYTLAHGKKLSSKRAAAVCKALVAAGAHVVASSHGFGGKRPQVVAKRAGARAANNRIVLLVTRN